jgi:DegV family protein with EDD domain
MSRVGLVTDSSTCLPPALVASLGIRVVPVTVHLPGADRIDGQEAAEPGENPDCLSSRISEAVQRDQYVRSSHPFITDYLAAIEDVDADTVVVVTPAMEFAGMYRNASLAAELAARTAVTIDSRTAAAGQALVVLSGAEAAAAGGSLDEVVRAVEDACRRVDLVASLDTLVPISRSHRVPAPALRAAELEGMRSVFRMRGGTVEPLGATSTTEESLRTIAKEWNASGVPSEERTTVFHADCPDLADRLCALIGTVDFVSGFSAAMQIHTGQGVVGAAWLRNGD